MRLMDRLANKTGQKTKHDDGLCGLTRLGGRGRKPRRVRSHKALGRQFQFLARDSASGRHLSADLAARGWALAFAPLGTTGFHLYSDMRLIVLDHGGDDAAEIAGNPARYNALFLCFLRALREAWQEERLGPYTSRYRPDSLLIFERARSADAAALSALIAWELRQEGGQHGPWHAMLAGTERDIALALAGGRQAGEAPPVAAAFRAWFDCENRLRETDRHTLDSLDAEMQEAAGPVFGPCSLDAAFVRYLAAGREAGRSYLSLPCGAIAADPHCARLNDPVHQAHLLQIIRESRAVWREGVPFRTHGMASRIFPGLPASNLSTLADA